MVILFSAQGLSLRSAAWAKCVGEFLGSCERSVVLIFTSIAVLLMPQTVVARGDSSLATTFMLLPYSLGMLLHVFSV
jgi:hypothetical protein